MKDINFLFSESIVNKMEETESKKTDVNTGKIILAVFISLIAIGILLAPGVYLSKLERQIKTAEASLIDPKYTEVRNVKFKLEAIISELNKKKAIINDIDSKSVASSQILLMVEQAVPSGCYFSKLNYNGAELKLTGKAESSIIVAELMGNFDRLHTLSRVTESISLEQAQSPVQYSISYGVLRKGGK